MVPDGKTKGKTKMKHPLKHYRIRKDGTLRLVKVELVEDAPRPKADFHPAFLARRDAQEAAERAFWEDSFERLADAACGREG